MKLIGLGKLGPGKIMALFMVVAAVSAVALIWMGVRLLQQDRALEKQRLEDRREAVADRVVAELEQTLLEEELRLTGASPQPVGDDALIVIAGPAEFYVRPEQSILYYPVVPSASEISPLQFANAERFEFLDHNYERAATALRTLSSSREPAVRAGALYRLARNLRKAGRSDSALDVYEELKKNDATITSVPALLVALSARCALLEDLGRTDQLRAEAQELREYLSAGYWRLDRDTYLYYSEQVPQWIGQNFPAVEKKMVLTKSVYWLWENWNTDGGVEDDFTGRRFLRFNDTQVTVIWRGAGERQTGLVAGPDYQHLQWFDPVLSDPDFSDVRINLRDIDGSNVFGEETAIEFPETSRLASSTALPWDIVVVTADFEGEMSSFIQRGRIMMAGFVAIALLVIAASYLIARAVNRELAAARIQSDFVSSVSHEFRTPLTSMRQFTEMLVEDDKLPPEKRRLFYGAQDRATQRLSRLVESLLDFGRMEAGARPYRLEPLDAVQLVKSVVEEFRQESTCNGFIIDCILPDNHAMVNGDWDALTQALWNFLDNAVKYSGDSRTVRVEVESGSNVAIHVHDEGYGIPPSERIQILRKFTRGSAAKVHGIKGTGIGLAMVKHIVDAHGGKLLIDSKPDKGSTFTIELPVGR